MSSDRLEPDFCLSRGEAISLAAQMLFPDPHAPELCVTKTFHGIDEKEQEKARRQAEQKRLLAEQNKILRWQYCLDLNVADLRMMAANLPDRDANLVPEKLVAGDDFIELVERRPPTDGFVRILTTKDGLLGMLNRVPDSFQREAKIASLNGQIAGSLLWYVYHMAKATKIKPSLKKARVVCIDYHPKRFKNPRGRPTKAEQAEKVTYSLEDSSLRDIWGNFKPVAHLWAAYLAMKMDKMEPAYMPLEVVNVQKFLCCAEVFASFGCSFKIPHADNKTPLNPDDLIRFPAMMPDNPNDFSRCLINHDVKRYIEEVLNK